MTSRVLLIGEAPGKSGRPGDPALEGRAGRRIARLCGIEYEEYLRRFDRRNLLPEWPGKAPGNGSAWPREEARAIARTNRFSRSLDADAEERVGFRHYRDVVLLGRRVADAFGLRSTYPWFHPTLVMRPRFWVAPHPSGASRWWNDPENVKRAEAFWKRIAR